MTQVRLAVAGGLLVLLGCRVDPRTTESPWRAGLERKEAELATRWPLAYRAAQADHADPSGVYVEAGLLWTFSASHPHQRGFVRDASGHWRPAGSRVGPRATQRCLASPSPLGALCVGAEEPRGLRSFGATPTFGLPERAGFRDVAMDRDIIAVLDTVDDAVVVLDSRGARRGSAPIPPAGLRLGSLGPGHVWVATGLSPFLSGVALGSARGPTLVPARASRTTPVRDAAWAARDDVLWTVGPADGPVRREQGPLEGLYSELVGYSGDGLRAGDHRVVARLDLRRHALVDATRVLVTSDHVVLSATGSDRVLAVRLADLADAQVWPVGPTPLGLAAFADRVVVACRLDDALWELTPDAGARRLALDDRPRALPQDLGERLFYGALLWRPKPGEGVACNGCHWDTGTDHRVHPGFLERRQEVTRPLGGIGQVVPIFTTGGAPTLSAAVEGLFRSLDPRLWNAAHDRERWWEEPVVVTEPGGRTTTLSAQAAREALLDFLMALPVPPSPLRAAGETLSPEAREGWTLFQRDCARCHRPAPTLRSPEVLEGDQVVRRLQQAPLVFGAAAYAKVAAGENFTSNGNRISPLLDLGRGGPWFASGTARTLDDVLRGFRPGRDGSHGDGTVAPTYDGRDTARLRAFLLSL